MSITRPRSGIARGAPDRANLACLLWEAAAHAGQRPALLQPGRAATYAELQSRAAAVRQHLDSLGVRPGDRVALLLERGIDAAACYFGILAAGAVAVVVNDKLRPRQIEHVLRHSGAAALLTTRAALQHQPRALETQTLIIDIVAIPAGAQGTPRPRIGADLAQIVFTSGSTGLPKGVVFTHANLQCGARTVASYLGLTADDRIASLLPLSSVYGLNQLLCAVASRASLVVELSTLPDQIESVTRAAGVTVLAAVPPLWLQLLRVPRFTREPMPALRIMQNAGGHLPVDAVHRLRTAQPHAHLFLQYGLTEAFRSTFLDPREVDVHPDAIGRAVPGAEIFVLRDDDTVCEVDEVGELVHRGATVAAGYWDDAEATARVFRANPLRPAGAPDAERVVFSGDLVRRDAHGLLHFVGRRDRMIKTLGYRVAPDEVADVLLASGQVVEAVVTGEPDGERGERVVAYVVLSRTGSRERLVAFCRAELPRYMQPGRYELRESLPRLGGGKYDLAALRQSPPARSGRPAASAMMPATATAPPPPP